MSTKRPANGCNYAKRRSNMTGKGKKWKEQLVQGVKEGESREALLAKLDADAKYRKEQKQKLKDEARQADIAHGFVDATEAGQPREVPEWKKQKMFLAAAFPPPIICKKYKGELVFKNKQSMQGYHRRVLDEAEWEANASRLMMMRLEMEERESALNSSTGGDCVDQHHDVSGPDVDRAGEDACPADSSDGSEDAGEGSEGGHSEHRDLNEGISELNIS